MDISETTQPAEPYSAFTVSEKRVILFLAAFAAMFSPLSSFIYYPATSAIAKGLNTSISNVNLGITTYMIVSGIIPAVVGDMADHVGRRPVYIVTFAIYLGANLGLACQRTLPSLLVLRMIQSAGSSGAVRPSLLDYNSSSQLNRDYCHCIRGGFRYRHAGRKGLVRRHIASRVTLSCR